MEHRDIAGGGNISTTSASDHFYQAPYEASEVARKRFLELRATPERPEAWVEMTTLASGRILTLSDFQVLDPAIEFCDQWLHRVNLPDEVLANAQAARFGMLVFRNPAHPDIATAQAQCQEVAESCLSLRTRLAAVNYLTLYHIWCGRLLEANRLCAGMSGARRQTDDPCTLMMSHSISSMVYRLFLDYAGCEKELKQGLALAEKTGIHLWDSHFYMQQAFLALSRNNVNEGGEALTRMNQCAELHHYLDRSGYQFCQAWRYSLLGELQQTRSCAEESLRLAQRSGAHFPQAVTHMGVAQACLQSGEAGRALYHFSKVRRVGKPMKSDYVPFVRALAVAQLSLKVGLHQRARRLLRYGLELGKQRNYYNFPWWQPETMSTLCQEALDANIEPEYVRELIRRRRLLPPRPVKKASDWEWPLKIELCKGPLITLDDAPVKLSGKGRELLWVLCILGVNGRAVLRHRIEDILWPELDGDKARQVLDTTLHRLRRKLGSEAMIRAHHGSLSLAPGLTFVDLWWSLERLQSPQLKPDDLMSMLRSLHELPMVMAQDWPVAIPVRRLQRLFTHRLLDPATMNIMDRRQWLFCLDEAVQVFPDAESLWLANIDAHLNFGLINEARQRLDDYREIMLAEGLQPSPAITQMEERLHGARRA